MPDFKYLGPQSSKNKRRFISQKAFIFCYTGGKKNHPDIVKELGSIFASQSFHPFELVVNEGSYAIHILARHKNIRIPVNIAKYPRSITNELYYIGVNYSCLGSKFEYERSKLERVLENACRSLAGKSVEV
ncbi:MAG: hypothetical protein QW404_01910 [Candidatus Nanoarchaeia archaeon]